MSKIEPFERYHKPSELEKVNEIRDGYGKGALVMIKMGKEE